MSHDFLQDLVVIFFLSLIVIIVFKRFRMPVVLGFLVTGIIAGPHALALIQNREQIEVIAEVGVILLLFSIGIEFSLRNLLRSRRAVFITGSMQVFFTVGLTAGIMVMLNKSWNVAIFGGFLAALSSTAIVMKILQERADVQSSHGRIMMGILIFQDIAVVPMMLMIPLLSGENNESRDTLLVLIAKIVGILVFLFIMIRWVVPKLLHTVILMKRRDLFLLTLLLLAFSIAWLTSFVGLSLALGGFLAGLIISESEYHSHAFGDILPFRDLFFSFFFVSVGMLLDPVFVINHPALVFVLVVSVVIGKALLSFFAVIITGYSAVSAAVAGLAISQVGEFSFVLAQIGHGVGLIEVFDYQLFLAVAVITMAFSPFLISVGPTLGFRLRTRLEGTRWITGLRENVNPKMAGLENHLVLIGYGRNGRNIARAASNAGITYAIIDFDVEKVRTARKQKEKIFFGDASHDAVLRQVNIEKASVVVIAIADSVATLQVMDTVRKNNAGAYLIIRTRYTEQMDTLYNLGADEVIPEEIETSVKIFTSVLARFLIPTEEIDRYEAAIRAKGYEMLLAVEKSHNLIGDYPLPVPDTEIATFKIREDSVLAGSSIRDSGIKDQFKLIILAVRRKEEFILTPDPDFVLIPEDQLVVFGRNDSVLEAGKVFRKTGKNQGDLGLF